jgi:hypothetical protein
MGFAYSFPGLEYRDKVFPAASNLHFPKRITRPAPRQWLFWWLLPPL